MIKQTTIVPVFLGFSLLTAIPAAIAQAQNVIVAGSECIGTDCVEGEIFGADTLRLKENNLRIHFDDTTANSGTSFPSNDWRILINSGSNGGGNYFAIQDATANQVVLQIDAGAPLYSMRVNSAGNLGLGTANPLTQLHIVDGNSPTLRLNQDSSHGWKPYIWDIVANEAALLVRDTTHDNQIPFRINTGASNNSFLIDNNGRVGLGTASPAANLHLSSSAGTAKILVQESNTTTEQRDLLELRNNGDSLMFFNNATTNNNWSVGQSSAIAAESFIISSAGQAFTDAGLKGLLLTSAGGMLVGDFSDGHAELALNPANGNLLVRGSLTATNVASSSSRALKENFSIVDPMEILAAVAQIPISKWSFKNDGSSVFHIGPMAEDFYALFGLGTDNKHISSVDGDGIALASIKALNQKLESKELKIADLEAQLAEKGQQLQQHASLLEDLSQKVQLLLNGVSADGKDGQ